MSAIQLRMQVFDGSHQVRTEINVETVDGFDLLLLAKYSSNGFSGCCLQGALAR